MRRLGWRRWLSGTASRSSTRPSSAPVNLPRHGTLTVLASGPDALRESVAPVFDAVGSRTIWVGERPGDGQKLKLVANSWVGMLITGTGQAIAMAEALGLDPQLFLDTIAGGPLDTAYAQAKGRAMIAGEFPTVVRGKGVVKDVGLISTTMRAAGVDARVLEAVSEASARRRPRATAPPTWPPSSTPSARLEAEARATRESVRSTPRVRDFVSASPRVRQPECAVPRERNCAPPV